VCTGHINGLNFAGHIILSGLEKESKLVDHTKYRLTFGSLLYLITSRLDIIFIICSSPIIRMSTI